MKIKKRLIFSKIKTILSIVSVVVILAVLIIFLKSDFWSIKEVTCKYDGASCSLEVEENLRRLVVGKNILFISRKKIREEILAKESLFKDLDILARLPSGLIIELKKRKPEAAIVLPLEVENSQASESAKPNFLTTGDFFVVDREGVILAKEKKSDLPLLLLNSQIEQNVGDRLGQDEVIKGIELIADLRLYLFEPKLVRQPADQSIEVWFKDNMVGVFSGKKDLKVQLDSLQLIFSRAKIEGRKIKRIDLRFDKPVATYE